MGYFTEKERYELEALRKAGISVTRIAEQLGKCERTIYYELSRGTVELIDSELKPYKMYCADVGQRKSVEAQRNKGASLKASGDSEFIKTVENLIADKRYSPYAVACALKALEGITNVCTVTIYNYIKRGFFTRIRQNDMPYIKKKGKYQKVKRVPVRNALKPLIEQRDRDILNRLDFGHWEMDTVYSGKGISKACLLVLTERLSRLDLLLKMPDRTMKSTVETLDKLNEFYGDKNFRKLFKTITCDNGSEFSDYEGITKNGRTKLYYCHPYCSGERGSNENNNKFVRRWIPKGDDIGLYTDEEIEEMQYWMNHYPRKQFNGKSSIEIAQMHKEGKLLLCNMSKIKKPAISS